jgi:hypothetical protein
VTQLAKSKELMQDQLQEQPRSGKGLSGSLPIKASGESFSQLQDVKKPLEDNRPRKRRESIIFELESWDFRGFPDDIFSTTLHCSALLSCVCLLLLNTLQEGRFLV